MSEYIHTEEFMNWVKGVTILKITKDGAVDYVKSKMQTFVNDLKHKVKDDDEHFKRFLTKVTVDGRVKKRHLNKHGGAFKYKIDSTCPNCNDMFEILQDNLDDSYKYVRWNCHDSSTTICPANYGWVLSKIYISYNIDSSLGPKDVDPLSVFSLMTLCTLFAAVKVIVVCLITLRNKLMHSKDNHLSAKDLEEAFENSKIFLLHTDVAPTSTNAVKQLESLKQKKIIAVGVDADCHELVRNALVLKKQCLENDMKVAKNEGNPVDGFENMLRNTTTDIVKETQKVYEVERRKTEEIQDLKMELDRKKKDLEFEQNEKQKAKNLIAKALEKERELDIRNNETKANNTRLLQKIQYLEEERLRSMELTENLRQEFAMVKEQLDQVRAQNQDLGLFGTCVASATAGGMLGGMTTGVPGAMVGAAIGPVVGVASATIKQYRTQRQ
ncbi:hypothetical protein ACF0H5_022144 [Mactra antiquata]